MSRNPAGEAAPEAGQVPEEGGVVQEGDVTPEEGAAPAEAANGGGGEAQQFPGFVVATPDDAGPPGEGAPAAAPPAAPAAGGAGHKLVVNVRSTPKQEIRKTKALNPEPCILNLKPRSLNPRPSAPRILNPKPERRFEGWQPGVTEHEEKAEKKVEEKQMHTAFYTRPKFSAQVEPCTLNPRP